LTATVVDSFGNPVKDTTVVFAVVSSSGGGFITSTNPVTTDSLGKARVSYKTGSFVGTNIINAKGLSSGTIPGMPDMTLFLINTDSVNANANYIAGTLEPRVVSQNQITAFKAKFVNTGSFPITLGIDSTYILYNDGVTSYKAYLDTGVSKTIGVGTSQITFNADTIKLGTGPYPGAGHTAQIYLYGSVFDSAAVEYDTLRFTFGPFLDTLKVQSPARIILDSVKIVQSLAVRGQDSIKVDYYVRNSGEATAVNFVVRDSIRSLGNMSTDWVLLGGNKPDSIRGGNSSAFTQYYRIISGARLGVDTLTTRIHAIDFNDASQITRDSLLFIDTIRVVRPAALQITQTILDTLHNDPFINRNQLLRMRSLINNFGDESAQVRINFASTGGGINYDTTLAGTVNGNSSVWVTSRYFNVMNALGVETYSAFIDSAFGNISLDTVSISDPVAGNLKTLTVQDSAKLKLDLFVLGSDSSNLTVSDSAVFQVYVRVINLGSAPLSRDSVPVRITLPSAYNYPSGIGVTDSIVTVYLNQTLKINLRSRDTTASPDSILAIFDTASVSYPRDLNNSMKSIVYNNRDSVFVKASKVGTLVATQLIVDSPSGATDDTVSTFQQFRLRAQVKGMSRLSNIRAVLGLNKVRFSTPDSLTQNVPPSLNDSAYIYWTIVSNKDTVSTDTFSVFFVGIDTTTQIVRTTLVPQTRIVNVVRRADLSVNMAIISPFGATDDTISAGQQFTVSAKVTNAGTATVNSGGALSLNLSSGLSIVSGAATQAFIIGDSIKWTLLTATPLRADTIRVNISTPPSDNNTNLAAYISKRADTVRVYTEPTANIFGDTITLPGKKDTVSTEQIFTIQASVQQLNSLVNKVATISFSNAATGLDIVSGDTLQKPIADGVTSILWSVKAANSILNDERVDTIYVQFTGNDKNSGNPVISQRKGIPITIQTKARLALSAAVVEPYDATDKFVMPNQTFILRAKVSNTGRAGISGVGSIRLDSLIYSPGQIFVATPLDTAFNTNAGDDSVKWSIVAPSGSFSHPLVIRFGTLKVNDANTGQSASEVNNSINLTISSENKKLQVKRIQTDTSARAAAEGERIKDVIVLGLDNLNLTNSPVTGHILARNFGFEVYEYVVGSGIQKVDNWKDLIDSIQVYRYRTNDIFGRTDLSNSDTAFVRINGRQYRAPGSKSLANVFDGLFVRSGISDTVSFAVYVKNGVTGSNRNFSIRLAQVEAFDYDTLGYETTVPLGSLPPVDVRDDRGRRLEDIPVNDASFQTLQAAIVSTTGPNAQKFGNYPNPFGSGSKPLTKFRFIATSSGDAHIEIYTLAGNLVRKLQSNGPVAPSIISTIEWDGKNMNGQKVRNGVYIAVLKAPGVKATTKVLIVR
ncbi:T9SS type A sorting domain-containing protein, partial [bacterium]|nr:T9SS type A sorting domain-containing protein [bacterium]